MPRKPACYIQKSMSVSVTPPFRNHAFQTLLQVLAASIMLLSGCASLPRSGPSTSEIEDAFAKPDNELGVHLLKLAPEIVDDVAKAPRESLDTLDRLAARKPVDEVGPGDVLSISIFEAGPGLFSASPRQNPDGETGSSAETLPRVQVDRSGRIAVPFAGSIVVAGHTTSEIQGIIQARLAEKAVEPQVIVTLVTGDTNSVIVSGDVKNPGRRQLTLAGENLLDAIALSGGVVHDPADSLVKVTRTNTSAEMALPTVQSHSAENIRLQPQDRVQVTYAPRSFLVFGATGKVAEVPLERERVSLAEAMARVGGLDDSRANPSSVYLFRFEDPKLAGALHVSQQKQGASLPIVYQADLRDPQNLFLMQKFVMEDKDLIYVANAGTVQLNKVLQLFYTLVSPVVTGRQLSQ